MAIMGLLAGLEHITKENEPLYPYVWFNIGGPAQYFVEPNTPDELIEVVRRCRRSDVPIRLLGRGSNVLVREEGVPGVVIRLSAPVFSEIKIDKETITVGGGANLAQIVSASVGAGLAGLDSLVGIPGSVGGALHKNAGSRGGDIGQWTHRATVVTRTAEVLVRERDDMQFAYRQSSLDELAILKIEFHLEKEDPEVLTRRMQKLWILKRANQPLHNQSTGCIFRDPRGTTAAALIEKAGLKGSSVGSAAISERHPEFVNAPSGTTSQDILRLIDLIRSRVLERTGIELENELEIW